jgi:ubiquinone/menaquinone biosynthesis C-methylase UbiE
MAFDYDLDSIASKYGQHRQAHPEVLRSLVLTGEIGRASKVLDVGCGTGNYSIALGALTGCACWGVDLSGQMLSVAKMRSNPPRFVLGRAEHLSFPRDCFDVVFSVDVVHHLSDVPAYLREVHRSLKMGGKVCTATDSAWIIQHREPLAVYFPETAAADLRRYHPVGELRDAMARVGFGDITQDVVAFSYRLTDIQAYRDKAFSSLRLISTEAFEKGISQLEQDMRTRPVRCVSRYALLWGTKRGG